MRKTAVALPITSAWALAWGVGSPDPVEDHRVGGCLDVVEHVVHGRDERVDVFAIDGRDERLAEPLHYVVHDLVAHVFVFEDGGGEGLLVAAVHELDEQLGRRIEIGGQVREQPKIVLLLGNKAESHEGSFPGIGPVPRATLRLVAQRATPPCRGGLGGAAALAAAAVVL